MCLVKVCEKRHILREKKQQYVKREKEVLMLLSKHAKTSAPFFVRLFCTFQDHSSLCKYFYFFFIALISLSCSINKFVLNPRFCPHTCNKWGFTYLSSKSRKIWRRSSTVLYCRIGSCCWTYALTRSHPQRSKTRKHIARYT